MNYNDFTNDKNSKVDFRQYLGNFDEPADSHANDSRIIPDFDRLMNPKTMRKGFKRIARKLRDV